MGHYVGDPVVFELNTADAAAAALPISIRNAGGGARTLAADERLIIQTVNVMCATGIAPVYMFDDVDGDGVLDAGELLMPFSTGISMVNIVIVGTDNGISCSKGLVPKVKSNSAGQIYLAGTGCIVKG